MTQGDVETPFGTLRCTLRAAKEVNSRFGSFMAAARRVEEFDQAACILIAAIGLDKKPEDIEDKFFEAGGVNAVFKPVNEYLGFLARGGRPLVVTEGTGAGER